MVGRKIFLSVLLVVCVFSISAWDGSRKGFQLGMGAGGGFDSYQGIQFDPIGIDKKSNSSLAVTLQPRIGYGITDQIVIYYSRHPFFYRAESDSGKEINIMTCIESIHADYYFKGSAPSLFVGLGCGIGYFMDEATDNYSDGALRGLGLFGSVGVEPIKHITFELSVHYKSVQKNASNLGVSLMVNAIGY